jgi:hypothetical protein
VRRDLARDSRQPRGGGFRLKPAIPLSALIVATRCTFFSVRVSGLAIVAVVAAMVLAPAYARTTTTMATCASTALPLTYPGPTLLRAVHELHPETAKWTVAPAVTSDKWASRFVAEAFLYTTGALGVPYTDLPDGATEYAADFVRWADLSEAQAEVEGRPTLDAIHTAWSNLAASLVAVEGVPDQDVGNCALVVLRSTLRSDPYAAGELFAGWMGLGYGRTALSGLRSILRTATDEYLSTNEGPSNPEGALAFIFSNDPWLLR